MKKIFTVCIAFCVVVFSSTVFAATKGNAKAGKTKSELCQGCHGADGNSETGMFPKLAGQKSGYIVKQIKDFQSGKRVNETMTGMAATVTSVKDLKDIAAYFGSQKTKPGVKGKSALIKAGEKIFLKGNSKTGLYGCVNCHGKNGRGKSPKNHVFPVIGRQHKEYLVNQLKAFKKGERSNDPAGMMGDIAKKMSDKEIDAVTEYLSSLK